jgi:hypothetical protein
MLHEEMKRLAGEFGIDLTEDVDKEIAGQLKRAEKLDEVETITFGLETDDGKIVKVFVNAKDAEKFEKIMADCLGATDSIEDAINKAAGEVDIIDVEWPDDDDEDADPDAAEDDGSSAMDPAVYGDKKNGKESTKAKKDETATMEGMSYGEHFSHVLTEEQGSISSRMTTPNQQLVYQAILDLGIPEIALDRSPYRAALIKGLRTAAQELAANSGAKVALKAFVRGRIDDNKHSSDHVTPDHSKKDEPKAAPVDPKAKPVDPKAKPDVKPVAKPTDKKPIKEEVAAPAEVVISEAEDGIMITCGSVSITLDLEELERIMKAIEEKATTVIGNVTVSPRGTTVIMKMRGAPERIELNAPKVAELKELATQVLE